MTNLKTERLNFRQWQVTDFEEFAEYFSDEELTRYVGGKNTREEAWRFMATYIVHYQLKGYGYLAVENKSTNKLVGCVGLWNSEPWSELELGNWLLSNMQEKGYGELTTNHIAERAGVSIGSLYQYFPNKEAIVAELIKQSTRQDRQYVNGLLNKLKEAPLDGAIREIVHTVMDRCDDNLPLAIILREQIPRVKWTSKMREATASLEHQLTALFKERYPDHTESQLQKIAFIAVQTLDAIVNETIFNHPEWLHDDQFRNLVYLEIATFLKQELG